MYDTIEDQLDNFRMNLRDGPESKKGGTMSVELADLGILIS